MTAGMYTSLAGSTTAQKLAAKPAGALRASKRLLKQTSIGQLREAAKFESHEFSARVHSAEATEAFTAFREKRAPNFTNLPKPRAAE
ncbi:hypothetical protein N2603_13370 [Bradyrhizobium huanghuaihaiense]|uniref:hypothetical protein n=1 Tax=Bradyrhizobium huanghuaihaiense TaxID=990078 RepID=UPI0021AA96F9|nr:hypothetical protein [Bradyrhizobium sp. CB3035]UWU79404.1 hypothetical protein N2603_13370 [Bradyrhizobium sp. CB3035]